MNRHALYTMLMAVAAVCAGCSGDDADGGNVPSASSTPWTVIVPIEIVTTSAPTSRATTGDPGVDDELDPPANVYAFSWIQTGTLAYEMCYVARTGLTADNWTYYLGSSGTEDQDSRYSLNGGLSFTFDSYPYASAEGLVGHTYVIASEKELTSAQLESIYSGVTSLSSGSIVELTSSPDATLKAATVSFSDCFSTSVEGAWQSNDFRDLYSNPVGNKVDDDYEYGDIYATSDGSGDYVYTHTAIRLYHCAAKIDFLWEVDADLQSTTSVEEITVSSLPTVCKIFQPTGNPTANTTTYTLSTDDGNKWIGREYFYALQPAEGYLTYGVSFGGSSNRTAVSGATTSKSADFSDVFTGWFRVIATVSATE